MLEFEVVDALDEPLAAAAEVAAQQPAAPPGAFCSQSWAATSGSGGGGGAQPKAKRARLDHGAEASAAVQPAHTQHPEGDRIAAALCLGAVGMQLIVETCGETCGEACGEVAAYVFFVATFLVAPSQQLKSRDPTPCSAALQTDSRAGANCL